MTPTVPDHRPVMLAGEMLVDAFSEATVPGGAPFNVARSLAALGLETLMVSRLGRHNGTPDVDAALLLQAAAAHGMSATGIQWDDLHPTGRVRVSEAAGGHHFEIASDAAWDHLAAGPALTLLEDRQPGWLVMGTLAQRSPASRHALQALAAAARSQGCEVYLDLNLREGCERATAEASLALAGWLKINDAEWLQLGDWFELPHADPLGAPETLRPTVAALQARFGIGPVVLTRGKAGYACFGPGATLIAAAPAHPLDLLRDTVGAGDAFSAMLLAALVRGRPLHAALALANRYAAAICGERGAVPARASFFTPWREALDHGASMTGAAT